MCERRAYNAAVRFHESHRAKTFNPGMPGVDPWMRDVLVSLQETLQAMGNVIDDQEREIRHLREEVAILRSLTQRED